MMPHIVVSINMSKKTTATPKDTNSLLSSIGSKKFAKEIIQFFWISLEQDDRSLSFPIAHFEVATTTGALLYELFWKGVRMAYEVLLTLSLIITNFSLTKIRLLNILILLG
jgi:hypothetical protein